MNRSNFEILQPRNIEHDLTSCFFPGFPNEFPMTRFYL